MHSALRGQSPASGHRPALLVLFLGISLSISLAAVCYYNHSDPQFSLYEASNLVGPTTQSLLAGRGLTACTEAMGMPGNPICFHAGRMPMASLLMALGIKLLGDNPLRVNLMKTLLLLAPLEFAVYLVWLHLPPRGMRPLGAMLLLLAPFGMTVFLADVRLMQVEEGYTYSLLALAVAMLFFAVGRGFPGKLRFAVLFGATVDGVYLAKSSMLLAAAVLVAGYLLLERRCAARALVLAMAIAAPVGWALYQHHASGRYSVGTSLDGLNLHKGNNPDFLRHYPPPPGESLDQYDSDLNYGLHFTDEWSFDDYHRRAAVGYAENDPQDTLTGDLRKLTVLFVSLRKVGSSARTGAIETAGLLVFRLLLWTALAGAAWWTVKRAGNRVHRITGATFLALVAACTLPYVAGFAYTRHVSILIYPAALMCCRMLLEEGTKQSS